MRKTLSTEDCLKQAQECIEMAEAASDPELREQYIRVAGDLTRLAGLLDAESRSATKHRQ
ncbi:MAG TPA: hypothetical protein VFW28_03235 [Micropepsaceae bacterium]|nr:hypothetical protein [Micropepsaceae bacterium]